MNNKYSSTLLGVALGLGLMAGSANAAVLQVNLGPTGLPTETDFTDWTTGDNTTPSATTINGIGLSVNVTTTDTTGLRSLNRTDTYNGTLDSLTQTWWGVRSGSGAGGQFAIVISGSDLGAGTFGWTSWHHDHGNQTGTMDIDYSVDGGTNFTLAFDDFDIVDGAPVDGTSLGTDNNVGAPNPATFSFTSNGTDDIHIRFTNVQTGAVSAQQTFALVNGFQVIPEPSAALLGGLGLLALLRRRR